MKTIGRALAGVGFFAFGAAAHAGSVVIGDGYDSTRNDRTCYSSGYCYEFFSTAGLPTDKILQIDSVDCYFAGDPINYLNIFISDTSPNASGFRRIHHLSGDSLSTPAMSQRVVRHIDVGYRTPLTTVRYIVIASYFKANGVVANNTCGLIGKLLPAS